MPPDEIPANHRAFFLQKAAFFVTGEYVFAVNK